ncbi:MAG: PstA family ABC transporter permease [Phycisphaerae bacterium]
MTQVASGTSGTSSIRMDSLGSPRSRRGRSLFDKWFVAICLISASGSILALLTLITSIVAQAFGFVYEHWFPLVMLAVCLLGAIGGLVWSVIGTFGLVKQGNTAGRGIKVAAGWAVFAASVIGIVVLSLLSDGESFFSLGFITNPPSLLQPTISGIGPATIGTLLICTVCAVSAIPIGIATAVLLEEYRPRHPWLRRPHAIIQLNITNLAGVPSIVYGILGLTLFVQMFGLAGNKNNPAFEVGVQLFDQFQTASGDLVFVKVASRDDPLTVPAAGLEFFDRDGNPVAVDVVTPENLETSAAGRILNALYAFQDSLDAELAASDLSSEQVRAAIDEAWAETGFIVEAEPFKARLTMAIAESDDVFSSEAMTVYEELERAEIRAELGNTLPTTARPNRRADTEPWYLRLPFERSVLAGGLTLMLVVLPIVIISSQESLRAVPTSLRQASLALGATPWQTVWKTTLPTAIPGIMTGTILSMSRAIGEAAPILVVAGGIVFIRQAPNHLMDSFTAMPLQIYYWAQEAKDEFHDLAACGIVLLLAILLSFNAVAVFIRQKTQKSY